MQNNSWMRSRRWRRGTRERKIGGGGHSGLRNNHQYIMWYHSWRTLLLICYCSETTCNKYSHKSHHKHHLLHLHLHYCLRWRCVRRRSPMQWMAAVLRHRIQVTVSQEQQLYRQQFMGVFRKPYESPPRCSTHEEYCWNGKYICVPSAFHGITLH